MQRYQGVVSTNSSRPSCLPKIKPRLANDLALESRQGAPRAVERLIGP